MELNVVKLFIEFGEKKTTKLIKLSNNFPYVIGRQGADLSIKDPKVSRRHCQLIIEAGTLNLEDLGSSNGVEVNGTRTNRARLKVHDQIKLGSTRIKVLQITMASKKMRKGGDFF